MSDKLQKKIRQIEDEHAESVEKAIQANHEKDKHARALLLLGGIRAVDRVRQNLSSQVMTALITFQDEDMHESLGYDRFADFLDNSEYSPMKKSDFYRRKELFEKEGSELYDAFNAMKIPLSTRKLLAQSNAGEIHIEGDKLIIGETEVAKAEKDVIKEVVESLAKEIRTANSEVEKQKAQNEKLQTQIKEGVEQYEILDRKFQGLTEGSPLDRAQSQLVNAFIRFNDELSKTTVLVKTGKEDFLDTLWMLLEESRKRIGSTRTFSDSTAEKQLNLSDLTKRVLAEDDDFGDDD